MKDRVSAKPNRYAVYDDNHNFIRYEYHERADEPIEAGSALNKENMLPDDVAAALGLTGNDPQVKDALGKLNALTNSKAKIETGSYVGTGTFGESNPNSLTFGFVPKIIFIRSKGASTMQQVNTAYLSTSFLKYGYSKYMDDPSQYDYAKINGNTFSWYNPNSAGEQFNNSTTYYYIAIG